MKFEKNDIERINKKLNDVLRRHVTKCYDEERDELYDCTADEVVQLSASGLSFNELQQLLETTPSVALTGWVDRTFMSGKLAEITAGTQVLNQTRGWYNNPTCPGGIMEVQRYRLEEHLRSQPYLYLKSYGGVEYWIVWDNWPDDPSNRLGSWTHIFAVAICYNRESTELFSQHQSIINGDDIK